MSCNILSEEEDLGESQLVDSIDGSFYKPKPVSPSLLLLSQFQDSTVYSDDHKAPMTDCIFQRWMQELHSTSSSRILLLTHQEGQTVSPSFESVWLCDLLINSRML